MTKKQIQLIVVGLALIAASGWFFYNGGYRSNNIATENPNQSQSTENKTIEDLVKNSAQEINQNSTTNTNSKTDQNVSDVCVSQQVQTFGCYEDYYKSLVKVKGVATAFTDLRGRYDQNAYVKSQCHPITHVIGNAAAIFYGDVGTAYTKGDSFCWSGYYHGVMEGVIGGIAPSELAKKMDAICNAIPGKSSYSFDYYNCVHGLGHGVMAISQNELFDSLELCDNLVGNWEQSSCHGGAFMENVIIDNKNHFTKYLKPEEPLYPCTAVGDKYKTTCYLMQTSYMLKVTNGDFKKVFELCRTVGNYSAICYQSLGRDASGRSISNVEITKATCNLGTDFDQKSNCIIGAVKDFISYHHSDVQAQELCNSLEPDLQATCKSTAESYYTSFSH